MLPECSQNAPKMVQTMTQNDPKIMKKPSKWHPGPIMENVSKNDAKSEPGLHRIGAFLAPKVDQKSMQKKHEIQDRKNMNFDANMVSKLSQNRCQNPSKNNTKNRCRKT